MTDAYEPDTPETRRARLNLETARISWRELEKFHARGQVVQVAPEMDLVEVGAALIEDDSPRVKAWMTQGLMGSVADSDAHRWHHEETLVWSLVVVPWVLVQSQRVDSSAAPSTESTGDAV